MWPRGVGVGGAVGRVGVGNGCRVWLRWSDYRGMGEVGRRRCVGVEEGWKISRRGRQVWVIRSVAWVWLTGDRCGRLVDNEAA